MPCTENKKTEEENLHFWAIQLYILNIIIFQNGTPFNRCSEQHRPSTVIVIPEVVPDLGKEGDVFLFVQTTRTVRKRIQIFGKFNALFEIQILYLKTGNQAWHSISQI